MKFLEMMDDDFNTAGAIAVLHELAGATNALIESSGLEKTRNAETMQAVMAATQTLKNLGMILGFFRMRSEPAKDEQNQFIDGLMKLLIQLRAEARQTKNFAMSDSIRKGLSELGVTLEDRADATGWRRD